MFEPENRGERERESFREGWTSADNGGGTLPPTAPPPRRRGFSNLVPAMLLGALLCLGLGGFVGWQLGEGNASQRPLVGDSNDIYRSSMQNREQVIAQGRQAVVQINVTTAQGRSVGSGVIIDQQGNIVTNNHVIEGGQKFQVVLFDGS